MNEQILVRYGDLILKGRNQRFFLRIANERVREKLKDLPVEFDFRHDRFYVILHGTACEPVIERLQRIAGLYSFSLVTRTEIDFQEIAKAAIMLVGQMTEGRRTTFKVETKRADKTLSLTSPEVSRVVSRLILQNVPQLIVDVHHPEMTLNLELRRDGCYMFVGQIKGLGGFPIPASGKAMVLLSGGIDSPVAAFLAMKKGLETEMIHFESTPLTAIEAVQKVIDITAKLARYAPAETIVLRLVPFEPLHRALQANVPEGYQITIMRRMMIRIATSLMEASKGLCLVTGDSIGQVASQTLESMRTIQDVTDALIMRPLAAFDKLDIIAVARAIDTLEISNRAFSDCCSIYVPKNPVIRPELKTARKYEAAFAYDGLIAEAVAKTVALSVQADAPIDITAKGLTVKEALT